MIDFAVKFDSSCSCFVIEAKSKAAYAALEEHRGFKTKLILLPESEMDGFKEKHSNLTFSFDEVAI